MSKKIKIILGSVREKREGLRVAEWVMKRLEDSNLEADFELIDLKKENLPLYNEPSAPAAGQEPVYEYTRAWRDKISASDGFFFVTPEYNHGYPPALKNAVDYLYKEWKDKPVGFVGYGSSGASDSVKQMTEIVDFLGMKIVEDRVSISKVWEAFDKEGQLRDELVEGDPVELAAKVLDAV